MADNHAQRDQTTDLWWPEIWPPLTEEEKDLLRSIDNATNGIGFFGSTDECDFIHVLAVAVRLTRARDGKSS